MIQFNRGNTFALIITFYCMLPQYLLMILVIFFQQLRKYVSPSLSFSMRCPKTMKTPMSMRKTSVSPSLSCLRSFSVVTV